VRLSKSGRDNAKSWEIEAEVPLERTAPSVTLVPQTAPVVTVLPDTCQSPADLKQSRPQNGSEPEYKPGGEGHGKLVVTNGNSQDAAVILADLASNQDDRLLYVRSGMQATMAGISPGQYRIKFQIGKNWDEVAENFQCATGTAVFDKTESFTEEERGDGIEYSRLSITLHKVVRGNARSSPIPRQAFIRRHLAK
jgi:hypothetical protein